MNKLHIRRALSVDVSAIIAVRTSVIENHLTEAQLAQRGITKESLSQALNDGCQISWCAEADQCVVGFSLIEITERQITALFVLPDYEHRGIGSALLDSAVHHLNGISNKPLWLYADPTTPSFEFYKKRGWQLHDPLANPSDNNGDVLLTLSRSK